MKRMISFIVCVCLVFSLSVPAFAESQRISSANGIQITDNVKVSTLTEGQARNYDVYEVNVNQIPQEATSGKALIKDRILSICSLDSTTQAGSTTIQLYKSNTLSNFIPYCESITEISSINNHLYICYNTTNGKEVILCYDNNGLQEKSVYDCATDSAFFESAGTYSYHEGFRAGISYEMSEELQDTIDELIEVEDWKTLTNIDGLIVTITEDGLITIEPDLGQFTRVDGISNQTQLLADLKSDFPMYTNTVMHTDSKYCNALSKYVSVRVTESRNAYTKKTASFETFAAGTAVSAISLFIGGPITVAVAVLTAIGVGISLTDTLLQNATLARSATYTYTGNRLGYAYDTTVHNAYVRTVLYSGKGEFGGGYNPAGVFEWIRLVDPSAYSHDYAPIANTAIYNYNADIAVNGSCVTYFP